MRNVLYIKELKMKLVIFTTVEIEWVQCTCTVHPRVKITNIPVYDGDSRMIID